MKAILNIYAFPFVIWLGSLASLVAQEKNFIDQPYLETNVRVDSLVVPDRIHLNIAIREEDTKGRVSVEALENQMAAKLKSMGIDLDKQLTLLDLSANFRDYLLRKTDIEKTKSYVLLVYDGLSAGKVIRELESIGIANIQLQKTEYSGLEQLKITLRQLAVVKAIRLGEAMLRPLGQTLGKPLYISDLSTDYSGVERQVAADFSRAYNAQAIPEPLDLDFEKIRVEASINVKFAIGQDTINN